nr:ASCH domain protein [uncultured bacterium]
MKSSEAARAFWKACSERNPDVNPGGSYQVWYFGDSRELADHLCQLVLQGKKTATACLVWETEFNPDEAPVLNGYSIITDFDGNPRCIVRTSEIRIMPFSEVDEQFAADEGEGDLSLEFWRRAHWEYFSRKCKEMGKEASPSMAVVCERFEVVCR